MRRAHPRSQLNIEKWFTHERPRYLAVYGFALAFAGKLAPTLAGFINYGQGWEWTLVSQIPS